MKLADILKDLAALGTATTKRTLMRHGAPEPLFGVRIGDLQPLRKRLKGCQGLAVDLFATGNSDAMYLAGLIADGRQMSRAELDRWAATASWHMIASCPVAWVAAEHPEGFAAATTWIDSPLELVAIAGWSTLAFLAMTIPDSKLPTPAFRELLARCAREIHRAPNRVRYSMNQFVICVGTYVAPLASKALETAQRIGPVQVDMGQTDCQVPDAATYILKSRRGAPVAPKRKTARC